MFASGGIQPRVEIQRRAWREGLRRQVADQFIGGDCPRGGEAVNRGVLDHGYFRFV